MNHWLWVAAIVSGLVSAVTSSAQQPEHAVAFVEGVEPLAISYGDNVTGAVISPATDTDRFTFEGNAGDEVRVFVRSTTNGFDPRVRIRNPLNVTIVDTVCSGTNQFGQSIQCTVLKSVTLGESGTFTIFVSDSGTNETGTFLLQLEKIPPTILPTKKVFGSSVSDTINPRTDFDFFHFEGVAGTEIQFSFLSTTNGLDPKLDVISPSGAVVATGSCSGTNQFGQSIACSFTLDDLVLNETGIYYLVINDNGSNETGNYQLSLNCNFGPCTCLERDITDDGQINVSDLLDLLADWGTCPVPCDAGVVNLPDNCTSDIIRDCTVNVTDLLALLASWGTCN